jgi:hypothetical protein
MKKKGFNWLSYENAPQAMSIDSRKRFNYDIFSARTGNIYTTSLLKQWTDWSLGFSSRPDEIWYDNKRFYDPFRPIVEPNGFDTKEELMSNRNTTINAFKDCIVNADYFVFTLGLTESWFSADSGLEYPMCPGTAAGIFDQSKHVFENQKFAKILENLETAIKQMRLINAKLKFILTISPVPLTATKSDKHVLVATMQSKSILRAVASQLSDEIDYVDYFPSYEIINSPVFKGTFFEPNLRGVNPVGVKFVMDNFFDCLTSKYGNYMESKSINQETVKTSDDVLCEEEMLEVYGKR